MKKIFAIMLVLAAAGAGLAFYYRGGEKPQYRTEKVTRGDIENAVTASGTVNAVTTVLVGTQVSGTIKELYADFNSPVKKGQVIALIDPSTFEAQVAQARANLQAAKANLEKSQAALVDSERTMNRNKQLFAKGLIARSDLDTSETNFESARAQVSASKAQISQTDAALKFAETNLRYTKIISPVNGTVVSRNVDVGQTVAASFQTPTLFTIAQDLKKMQIDTSVAEADIGKVRREQAVSFTVDAYPETVFEGEVSEVRNAPIIVQNVVTYDVVVKVDNSSLKLKPGMTANASIVVAEKNDVLKVPNAALRFRMAAGKDKKEEKGRSGEKGPGVWTLKDGKPERVSIKAGISDGRFTEVLGGDLKEGQELVVESLVKEEKKQQQTGPRMF